METLEQQLCRLAAEGLKLEDKILRRLARKNASVYSPPEEQAGILRFNNEHYYQFLVARHLVGTLPYRVEAEVNKQDLILLDPSSNLPLATVEMKRWMSASGEREINGIRQDMEGKLAASPVDQRIMMVFSANPSSVADLANLRILAGFLGDDPSKWHQVSFDTIGQSGESFSFWVATREVGRSQAIAASGSHPS